MFGFRITCDNDLKIMKLMENKKGYVVKEDKDTDEKNSNGIHYHGLIYMDETSRTLRNWIQEIFDEECHDSWILSDGTEKKKSRGNAFFSINKIKDEEGWKRYLSKGYCKSTDKQPRVIVNTAGVDTERYNNDYWAINTSIATKRTKDNSRTPKQAFKEYFIHNFCNDSKRTFRRMNPEDVCEVYRQWLIDEDIEPSPQWSAKSMLMLLWQKYCDDDDNESEMKRKSFYSYCGLRIK